MDDLITRTLQVRHWVPYVGAGISLASGIPLGPKIVNAICRQTGEAFCRYHNSAGALLRELGILSEFNGAGFPLRMETTIEECERVSSKWNSLLSKDKYLFAAWRDCPPNSLHEFLALRLTEANGFPAVFTTNIDCLIEDALQAVAPERKKELKVLATTEDFEDFIRQKTFVTWQQDKFPLLVKLHGSAFSIDKEDTPETVMMSLRSLGTHLALGAKQAVIEQFAEHYSFGFFGYSGWDDFDLLPILRQVKYHAKHSWVWLDHLKDDSLFSGFDKARAYDRGHAGACGVSP